MGIAKPELRLRVHKSRATSRSALPQKNYV
jgi:hypothetical protein